MKKTKLTPRRAADNLFTYLALIVMSVIFLFPCLWLILASLSKTGSLYDFKGFFPQEYSFQTFIDLFTDDVNRLYPYKTWFFNTLYVAACSALFGTVLVLLTGYVMSRFRFQGRNTIKKTTLVLGMFPGFMGMTAIYIIMTQLGLINKLESLIFYYSATAPLGYMVQKGYFDTIPATIHEAARIDGCNDFQIVWRIIFPLSGPVLAILALYYALGHWNGYFNALMYIEDRNLQPLQIFLREILVLNQKIDMNADIEELEAMVARVQMAQTMKYSLIVVASVPMLIIYPFVQKFFVKGVMIGSVKG